MNKSEFQNVMETIKCAYGDRFQELTKPVLSVWYKCLSDLDGNRLFTAACSYIKYKQYPPTIADLREEYRNVRVEEPEEDMFERFNSLPPEVFEGLKQAGIIDAEGCINCFDATPEQIKILQECGAL